MDWTLKDNMVDGLFFCATLTGRRAGYNPFVQRKAEKLDAGAEVFKSDPGSFWEGHSRWLPVSGMKMRRLVGRVPTWEVPPKGESKSAAPLTSGSFMKDHLLFLFSPKVPPPRKVPPWGIAPLLVGALLVGLSTRCAFHWWSAQCATRRVARWPVFHWPGRYFTVDLAEAGRKPVFWKSVPEAGILKMKSLE